MSKNRKTRDRKHKNYTLKDNENIKSFDELIIWRTKQFSKLGIKKMYLTKTKKDCIYFNKNKGTIKNIKENAYAILTKGQFEINKELVELCEVLNTDKVYMKILAVEEFNNKYPNHKFNKKEN